MCEIYFDNAATTRPCRQTEEAARVAEHDCFGNPSSAHAAGRRARQMVDGAARIIGECLGVPPESVVFTSGGTEANNLAIFGVFRAYARLAPRGRGPGMVLNMAEHPSVTECAGRLREEGFPVSVAALRADGLLDLQALEETVNDETALVSLMHVNNETGVIQDIAAASEIIRRKNKNAILHVDGVQGLGKHLLNLRGVDLYTVSSHKIHGPKGVGACVVRNGVKLTPLFYGGGQQKGLRPGTENVAGAVGFAAAMRHGFENMGESARSVKRLKEAFAAGVKAMEGVYVNGREDEFGSPYIVNVSFTGVKAEVLRNALDERGIRVSTGSACRRQNKERNVLNHYGLPQTRVESALRFSFSAENTPEEVKRCLAALNELVTYLRKFSK